MRHMQAELKRVIKYAEGLGIKVTIKKALPTSPDAEWSTDGTEIWAYTRSTKSLTRLILDLLHELAHHMAFVYNNRIVPPHKHAVLRKADEQESKLTKRERRSIYIDELHDSYYQEIVFNELNLKIPKYKMFVERDLSNWIYHEFYITGNYPNQKDTRLKRKELVKKYKEQT
jgi:hypothetical protein